MRGRHASRARHLCIEVEDNGVGFDPGATGGGFGLVGMRERVEALQGEFTLSSMPGNGTQIKLVLPLNGNGEGATP